MMIPKIRHVVWPLVAAAAAVLPLGCDGSGDEGTFESAGEQVDEALEEAGETVDEAGDEIEEAADDLGESMTPAGGTNGQSG